MNLTDMQTGFCLPRRRVMLATAFYESRGYSPYIRSMTDTVKVLTALGIDHYFYELSGDSYAHRAKNTIMNVFLEDPEATDLFMVDSDMSWNADAVVNILMRSEEIVVGSYPQKNAWNIWTAIPKFESDESGLTRCTEKKLPNGAALMLGGALAGGFMVIKRIALEKFREHYKDLYYVDPTADATVPDRVYTAFFWPEIIDHKFFGEDRIFSRRLEEMGMKWWIYTDIHFSHFGVCGWSGNFKNNIDKLRQPAPINAASAAPVANSEAVSQ